MPTAHLAIDLGASSGRAILGTLDGNPAKLTLHELHRFEHEGLPTPTGPIWNLTDIWRNILVGLKNAGSWCREQNFEFISVGVDTWGVDWALIGESGELVFPPHCYRDPQNIPACDRTIEFIGGFDKLYQRTGIQLMPINTLFQVVARRDAEPAIFDSAAHLIFLPDLFHYWLSGNVKVESTIGSTSSMFNVETGKWDLELLDSLGIPKHLFSAPIVEPGAEIGTILPAVAEHAKISDSIKVVSPAGHDTGCAVAAVPLDCDGDWAYLSSGTWSLLGAEISAPNTSSEAAAMPFTNERGVDGSIRFLKNITGLWMVQELRRELLALGEEISFAEMAAQAESAEPFRTLIDPNFEDFLAPGQMAQKIAAFAQRTEQPVPETTGQLVRCCLESLALCYWQTTSALQSVLEQDIQQLYVVGGGSKNELLNQLTAEAMGCAVTCGPAEATAIGNVLIQAMGCGEVASLNEIRTIVGESFSPVTYRPTDDSNAWMVAQERYVKLIAED